VFVVGGEPVPAVVPPLVVPVAPVEGLVVVPDEPAALLPPFMFAPL
jgi:hypothetical protein